jgi:hypothetical protein
VQKQALQAWQLKAGVWIQTLLRVVIEPTVKTGDLVMIATPTVRRDMNPPSGVHPFRFQNVLSALLILALASAHAWATLGQSEATVKSDQLQLKSQEQAQTLEAYTVHQLTTDAGQTVKEFVSPQGIVFGVSWQGRSVPDMTQLLGTYINNLQTATPAQKHIQPRRGITVQNGDFVYSNFCRMQMCSGRAYIVSVVPRNVSAESIR